VNRIKKAGMTAHLLPRGLLLKLSKVYAVGSRGRRVCSPEFQSRYKRSRRDLDWGYF
jgi:hypothetical protein